MPITAAGGATPPALPAVREVLPDGIEHRAPGGVTPDLPGYRNPADLPDGGVLVVGPSASGIQIAHEVQASGRPVTLAVGEHVRMPRTYRGHDVLWWMDATGLFDDRYDQIPDLTRARALPSMQQYISLDAWPSTSTCTVRGWRIGRAWIRGMSPTVAFE